VLSHQPKDLHPNTSVWIGKAFVAGNTLETIYEGGGSYHINLRTCTPTPASESAKLLL
jgi:hypothetical protein